MNIISRIFLYIFGTLRLKLSGDYCERMLNILASNGISFYRPVKRNDTFYITVLRSDINKIRKLRKNTGIKINITKKSGFPIVYNRYKKRYGLILGFVSFVIILHFLSGRMWLIKVNGNALIEKKEVIEACEDFGAVKGININNFNSDILKQKLVMRFENISWAAVNKQGSVLEVNITEFTPEDMEEIPSNIVSKYDAIIKKVSVSKGTVKVKIGDTVAANSLLVSGIVNYGAGNSFVHSKGEILGEITFTKNIEIKKIQNIKNNTGEKTNRKIIDIMGLKIPLYIGEVDGEYKVKRSSKNVKAFGGELPITIYNNEYVFTKDVSVKISAEEARKMADKQLREFLTQIESVSDDIILVNEYSDEKNYYYTYDVIALVNIGEDVAIKKE